MGRSSAFLALLLLLPGCAGGPGVSEPAPVNTQAGDGTPGPTTWIIEAAPVSFTEIESELPADPALEALVAPFRSRMSEEIREIIGRTTGTLSKSVPEGTLGNLAADAMLWAANQAHDEPVHMALTNNGGLRVPIGAGPITVGQMFELMPFENMLSVVRLSGTQIQTLCDQVAGMRGEPIAGFSFRIASSPEGRVARDVSVGGKPLDSEAEYLLVTNDYLANGGGTLTPLHEPLTRTDLPVLVRDALIDYVRHIGVVNPAIEGRITGGIGS